MAIKLHFLRLLINGATVILTKLWSVNKAISIEMIQTIYCFPSRSLMPKTPTSKTLHCGWYVWLNGNFTCSGIAFWLKHVPLIELAQYYRQPFIDTLGVSPYNAEKIYASEVFRGKPEIIPSKPDGGSFVLTAKRSSWMSAYNRRY